MRESEIPGFFPIFLYMCMKDLRLYHLVEVSNNSRLTNQVFNSLNEKLSDAEKREFIQWLKIVRSQK